MKIRVAYLMNSYVPGGVKSLLLGYSSNLSPDDFSVDYMVCDDPFNSVAVDVAKDGGRAYKLPSLTKPLAYITQCEKLLKSGRYDIAQACMNTLNVFPLIAAQRAKVPIRISYSLSSSHPSEGATVIKSALRKLSSVGVTHRAANSRYSGEWLFGKRRPFKIIPNTYSRDIYYPSVELRKRVREGFGWSDSFVIGHIGRYQKQKNHDFLIDVFAETHKHNQSARLALVGHGSLKDRVMGKVEALGLSPYVDDLGATEDLNGLYNAFDCFVLPSLYEGMPVVGLEAQATGCPCVFSSEITREVQVNDNVSFMHLADSFTNWANEINRLCDIDRLSAMRGDLLDAFESSKVSANLGDWYTRLVQEVANQGLANSELILTSESEPEVAL